jgi:hypothetical protein
VRLFAFRDRGSADFSFSGPFLKNEAKMPHDFNGLHFGEKAKMP